MCVCGFGVALKVDPVMWHTPQLRGVPLKTAFKWQDSHGRSRWTPSSSKPVEKGSKDTVIGGVPAAATRIDGTSIEDARASNAAINGALARPADILIGRHPRDD